MTQVNVQFYFLMNNLLENPPKFGTDQEEIKTVLKGSKNIIKQQTKNVSKRATNVKQIAASINSNLQNIIERESELSRCAQTLLKRKEEIEKNRENFFENHKKDVTKLDNSIRETECKLSSIEDKCTSITTRIEQIINSEKPKETTRYETAKNEDEKLDSKLSEHNGTIGEIEEINVNMETQGASAAQLIKKTKNDIQEIEDETISLQKTLRLEGIDSGKKYVELKKYEALIQNIEQKIAIANQQKVESYGKLATDLTNKQAKKIEETTNKTSLSRVVSSTKASIMNTIKEIKEQESEKNEIKAKILQRKAQAAEFKQKLSMTSSEMAKIQTEQAQFLNNILQIRSIKVDTISKLKEKVFETKDACGLAQQEIDSLSNKEKTLIQKIRAVDVKIECARADNDLLFTHDICLHQLESSLEEKARKASDKVCSLNDIYESIRRRINGAEIEETRLNGVYVTLLSRNITNATNPEVQIKQIKQQIKETKKESREMASTINFLVSKCNNLQLSIQNKKREIEREKGTTRFLMMKGEEATTRRWGQRAVDEGLPISTLIEKVCKKKTEIEQKKQRIANKRSRSFDAATKQRGTYRERMLLNDKLSIEDLIWAIQSETYVWKAESTIFAKELLLNTWKHQLDLFQHNTQM